MCGCFTAQKGKHSLTVQLAESQGWKCAYCWAPIWHPSTGERGYGMFRATFDHVIPKSSGGHRSYRNGVAACLKCNRYRGDTPAIRFYDDKFSWRVRTLVRVFRVAHNKAERMARGLSAIPAERRLVLRQRKRLAEM